MSELQQRTTLQCQVMIYLYKYLFMFHQTVSSHKGLTNLMGTTKLWQNISRMQIYGIRRVETMPMEYDSTVVLSIKKKAISEQNQLRGKMLGKNWVMCKDKKKGKKSIENSSSQWIFCMVCQLLRMAWCCIDNRPLWPEPMMTQFTNRMDDLRTWVPDVGIWGRDK